MGCLARTRDGCRQECNNLLLLVNLQRNNPDASQLNAAKLTELQQLAIVGTE